MKIRSQVGMVLNLDKCIGCHTCSVTCKNVWTSREGVEYAWFNNVETKPGQGFPTDWENQEKYKGGWIRKINGKLQPRKSKKGRTGKMTWVVSLTNWRKTRTSTTSRRRCIASSKTPL